MQYQYKLKNKLIILLLICLALFVLFTILQFKYNNSCFSFINNIVICVLTGAIIGFIQSWIGYKTAKWEAILLFYKNTMIFEKMIYDHSVKYRGFSFAKEGFLGINELTRYFNNELKFSYVCVDKSLRKDKIILATTNIYKVYFSIYQKYLTMEKHLGEAIDFIEMSDEEISARGIDEKEETHKQNRILKETFREIIKELNDETKRKIINENFERIENYLFGKKSTNIKDML